MTETVFFTPLKKVISSIYDHNSTSFYFGIQNITGRCQTTVCPAICDITVSIYRVCSADSMELFSGTVVAKLNTVMGQT
jgi:hypothetical protein